MAKTADRDLSRRERQIMEIVFARGETSVTEIVAALPDPPSDTSVRTFLRILEKKGRVKRRREGKRHVYAAAGSRKQAARAALKNVLGVFFGDSLTDAIASHLADPTAKIDDEELKRLARLIKNARLKGDK